MLLLTDTWWTGIGITEKIFWLIAIPFTVIFIIQLVMTFVGGDIDHPDLSADHDASFDSDHGIGFQFLSIKNLMAFFAIFGWTGIALIHGGKSIAFTILIATLAGLLMMVIMAALIYYLGKLTESSVLDLNNAKGKIASVYLRVPPERKGMGKVQINVQGFQTLDAITDDKEEIPTGAVVQVTGTINNEVLLVTKQ